jgi:hypothetical protein
MRNHSFWIGLIAGALLVGLGLSLPATQAQDADPPPAAPSVLAFEAIPCSLTLPNTERFAASAKMLDGTQTADGDWRVEAHYFRAKVEGGWFVSPEQGGPFFYPDPDHSWDGGSAD